MRFLRRSSPASKVKSSSGAGLIRFVLTVAILAWAIRSFLFAPFSIPTGSMLPTLHVGDYLLAAKWPYGYSRYSFPLGLPSFDGRVLSDLPERGDVVVFRPSGSDIDFVKRTIGLPGDVIEVRGGRLLLNGQAVRRQPLGEVPVAVSPNSPCKGAQGGQPEVQLRNGGRECLYPAYRETLPNGISYTVLDQVDSPRADHFPETVVPAGHLFLMGDNRDDSLDSRYALVEGGIGFVPMENLVGQALVTFWSTDGSADYWKPWTWFTALRTERIGDGYSELGDE